MIGEVIARDSGALSSEKERIPNLAASQESGRAEKISERSPGSACARLDNPWTRYSIGSKERPRKAEVF
jgi:hypothetical protein